MGETSWVSSSGGARLLVEEHLPPSEPEEGTPTVVLAHGWTCTRDSWRPVLDELQLHRDIRVISYDQRGHGGSSMGDDPPSIRQLGDDLHAVIEATAPEGQLVLGGHSMGGMTIMAYAGRHHTELKRRVRGVVLVSTAASIEGRTPIPLEALVMGVAARAPRLSPGPLVPYAVQGRLLFGHGARREDVREAVRQIRQTKMPTIGKYFTALSAHDEVEALAHLVDVPTQILVGTADRLIPVRYSRMLADAVPEARLTVLPGLGHMLTYEAPGIVADALIEMIDRTVAEPAAAKAARKRRKAAS